MKNVCARSALLIAAIAMTTVAVAAQEAKIRQKQVPAAVLKSFKAAYPQAKVRGYAREKENGKVFFEVESIEGSTHRDVLYNPDGTVAEIEESIATIDLPAEAQQTLAQKYPHAVVTIAEKVTTGDKVGYEVNAKQGKRRISLEFDADGKLKPKGQ